MNICSCKCLYFWFIKIYPELKTAQNMKLIPYVIAGLILIGGCISPLSETKEDAGKIIIFTNLENPDSLLSAEPIAWKNANALHEGLAFSGKTASKLDYENEYSIVFEQKIGYIDHRSPRRFTFQAMMYSTVPQPVGFMVASVSGTEFYRSFPVSEFLPEGKKWEKVRATFTFPDSLKPSDVLKVYIWNRKQSELLIDDLRLEFEYGKE